MTDDLIEKVTDAAAAIEMLREEIDKLPDTKVINVIYKITTEGTPPDFKGGTVTDTIKGTGGDQFVAGVQRINVALEEEYYRMRDAANAADQLEADTVMLAGAEAELAIMMARAGEAMAMHADEDAAALAREAAALADIADEAKAAKEAADAAALVMLGLAAGAKEAGKSVGTMTIETGAAAFGMKGAAVAFGLTAQAIHLIIMGTFEFLAVFIPAMYAAAAGAAVLYQGIAERVLPSMRNLYTATEVLGPMFGKTAGDVLGLGHSLQTAQDMANPAAYELLGETLLGLKAAMGQLNSQGLSPFAQLGLDVAHMLDAFGAKMVVDLRNSMGQVNSLLAGAMQALREFGQIFGNVGHALLNFASAMPGAAELVLKLLDAFSFLIKAISEIPAPIITFIMLIEELYRWSGVLAGIFALVGRGIAALGTLGIPVFAKIGMNFGMMVANIISGVGGAIINFVAMGEKIGVFGARVDSAATSMVGALGGAADFMAGPWGAGIMLGALALTGLVLVMMHAKSATDQLIDSLNNAVSKASNLTVLNQIANGMAQASTATSQAVGTLNNTVSQLGKTTGSGKGQFEAYAASVYAAGVPVGQLTAEQQKLFQQNMNVIQGAGTISKAYGVDFTGALAMADMAGVKLASTQVVLGKNANQAGIQIQAMVLGYQKMDLAGGALNNTMNALDIQTQIQATQVSKVNSAWDNFIGMSTSLTGSFTQFNLDLQQMGNQAATVGGKITAFTGTTAQSVSQIAQDLKSFGGSSAQTWQAFNQSVSQANTFMDQLRIAATAGVVPQQQYGQAVAYMVQQLLPYASANKAALAEVMALAQESNGPAYDASKSLAQNYQILKNWTDANSVSSDHFSGMIDNLTVKLSNVTQVARNFAGTLQSDVLNAIANASVGTSNITGLTQNFTKALQQNSNQAAPAVKAAQDALTTALKQYGFTTQEITQIEQELSSAYQHNTGQAQTTGGATRGLGGNLDTTNSKAAGLAYQIRNNLDPALNSIPANKQIALNESATGVFTLGGMVLTGQQALAIAQMNPLKHAAGGIIPGYAPGQDTVPAMLSPGEGILTPQAVRMIGPGTVHDLNKTAKHFAEGGVAGGIGGGAVGLGSWTGTVNHAFSGLFSTITSDVLGGMFTGIKKGLHSLQTSMQGTGFGIQTNTPGNFSAWLAQAIALTGVPFWWGPGLDIIARYESGFNANAINLWDSNAAAGDPSRGLMQLIMATFQSYHMPGTSWNIYDPVANIAAAIRYIEARYGNVNSVPGVKSVEAGGGYVGYDAGGYLMPGLTMAFNGTGKPERVVPPGGAGEGTVIHNVVNLDGHVIWENQQQYTLRYSLRNSGKAAGVWSPL